MHLNYVLASTILVATAACGKKTGDEPEKVERAEAAKVDKGADRAMPSDQAIAYALGNKLGLLDSYVVMGKPEKASEVLAHAKTLASGLHLDPPHLPAKGEHEALDVGHKLLETKSEKVAYSLMLGYHITYAWFGAKLGVDITRQLADIEKDAKKSGIPESEWRVRYDAIKAHPDADKLDQLEEGLQAYLDKN
jgi:hypothetical protein